MTCFTHPPANDQFASPEKVSAASAVLICRPSRNDVLTMVNGQKEQSGEAAVEGVEMEEACAGERGV